MLEHMYLATEVGARTPIEVLIGGTLCLNTGIVTALLRIQNLHCSPLELETY